MKLRICLAIVLAALSANAQKVLLTGDATTKAIGQPSGVIAANNLQTYTGTRTNTSVVRFDGSGNVKSSAMLIADDGSVTLTGTGTGGILFNDSDASNWTRIAAPSAVTTNGVYFLPTAPQTGFWYSSLTSGTNAQISILNGVSKFVFLSSGGVPVTRALGTGLTDDGTSINASGGGGGTGATNVLVNGVNITQANFSNNWAYTFSVSGSTIKVVPTAPVTLTDAATVATDASLGHYFRVTLGGNRTLGNPTNPTDGQRCLWEITQDGTGGRTLTADSQFAGGNEITFAGGLFNISTNASSVSFLQAVYKSAATKWYVIGNPTGY